MHSMENKSNPNMLKQTQFVGEDSSNILIA